MLKTALALITAATISIATAGTGQTQSFSPSYSCGGKLSANEQLICSERQLANLDVAIADAYSTLRSNVNRSASEVIRQDQRAWLRQRQRCGFDYNCTLNVMQSRLTELKRELAISRPNPPQPPSNASAPLPAGNYGIYVLAHGDSLRLDPTADQILFTQNKSGNPGAPKQMFQVVFLGSSYSIFEARSGKHLHADGNGDRQVSTRYQPGDAFTRFILTHANEGCYFVQTLATNNYWVWEPNSQAVVVRPQHAGEESMFCFTPN